MAWTLCTKEDVVAVTKFPIADLQDLWSDIVEDLIKQEVGDKGLVTPLVVTDEEHSGDGSPVLIVDYPPITSVTDVKLEGSAYSASDYTFNQNMIVLTNGETFPEGTMNLTTSYVSGGTPDNLVKFAAITMITAIINYRGRRGADQSLKWADISIELGTGNPNLDYGLVTHLNGIMRGILRRTRVRIR